MSASVTKLADVLFGYKRLIAESQAANGEEAFLDGNVPPDALQRFVSLVGMLDPTALLSGIWVEELEQLQVRAEEE